MTTVSKTPLSKDRWLHLNLDICSSSEKNMLNQFFLKKEAKSFRAFSSFRQFALAVAGTTLMIATGVVTKAEAADFSFRGTFSQDDEVQLFDFSVASTSDVTLKSLSYAGGTQADGTVIPAGGFDPLLTLFDSSGNSITENDDGTFPDVGIDPTTGTTYDTFLEVALSPGDYTVTISQYDNYLARLVGNISLGFFREGQPNFTARFDCAAGQFCDDTGDSRTNEWAFDILNVDSAIVVATPEPSTILAVVALGSGAFLKQKLAKKQSKNS